MIVNATELVKKAKAEGYAIGAFNVGDYSTVEAVLTAAESLRTPVMLQIGDWTAPNQPEARRMNPFDAQNLLRFIRMRAEVSPIPVIIHLDHCPTFDGCVRAIQNGATSVMIDYSQKSFEENVAMTLKVKEICAATNVTLEAEIGHVSGHANSLGVQYTSLEGAKAFYEATGVDMLAVSIGTVHGVYKEEPVLQYDLIRQLNEALPCALVMHGASGLSPDQFKNAVAAGIAKINFATYNQLMGGAAVAEAAGKTESPRFSALVRAGQNRITEYVKEHIGYFGTKPID